MPIYSKRTSSSSTICIAAAGTQLEKACIDTIESGKMTKDLAMCIHGSTNPDQYLNTMEFLDAIAENLQKHLSS
ncbi:hypothetical protein ACTXT7_008489 [Hymenolepis weldensis]